MNEDGQLLHQFVENASESAFRELVAKHFDLVYSAALRQLNGDTHLAEDVAQTVFTDLARKARSLPPDVVLAGWLYQASRLAASTVVRTEQRRRRREQESMAMRDLNSEPEFRWQELAMVLDSAMGELKPAERDAVLLRFFVGKDFQSIGNTLGITADTAQKRVARALEKLRLKLGHQGVSTSATALAVALTTSSVQSAPAGLAFSVATASLAGTTAMTAVSAGIFSQILPAMIATKIKIIAAAVITSAVGVSMLLQHQSKQELQAENVALRSQVDQLANRRASGRPADPLGPEGAPAGTIRPLSAPVGIANFNAALREALAETSPERLRRALLHLAERIELSAIPAVMAQLASSPIPIVRDEFAHMLLGRWAETNAQAALAFVTGQPPCSGRDSNLKIVVDEWAAQDWSQANGWVQRLTASPLKNSLVRSLAENLAAREPKQANTFVDSLGPGAESRFLRQRVLERWALTDGSAAVAAAVKAGLSDAQSLSPIIQAWAQANGAAAIEWLKAQPDPAGDLSRSVVSGLAPDAATDFAASLPPGSPRDRAIDLAATKLARLDRMAALEWLQQLDEGAGKYQALRNLISDWSETDPSTAAELAAEMPISDDRSELIRQVTRRLGEADPRAAVTWAVQNLDGNMRSEVLPGLVRSWAMCSPEEAATFAAELPPSAERDLTVNTVLSSWAVSDPQGALAWLDRFPDGTLRKPGVGALVSSWARHDPAAAGVWLDGLPKGEERNAGISAYAITLVHYGDPNTAMKWVLSISDEQLRLTQQESVAAWWLARDRAAATSWILDSELPKTTKQRLLRRTVLER